MSTQLSNPAGQASAKARRRIAKHRVLADSWWRSLPVDQRRGQYTGQELETALGRPLELFSAAMRELGWQRVVYRPHMALQRIVWIPPGYPSPLRPRGRPRKAVSTESTQPHEAQR